MCCHSLFRKSQSICTHTVLWCCYLQSLDTHTRTHLHTHAPTQPHSCPYAEGSEGLEVEASGQGVDAAETEFMGPVPVEDANYDPDLIPGIDTGDDVIEFYGKYGQDR